MLYILYPTVKWNFGCFGNNTWKFAIFIGTIVITAEVSWRSNVRKKYHISRNKHGGGDAFFKVGRGSLLLKIQI